MSQERGKRIKMIEIKDNNIRITQGDDYPVVLGYVSRLASLDLRIQVRTAPLPSGELVFEGTIVQVGDELVWQIRNEDTASVPIGKYYYDIYCEREIGGFDTSFGQHITNIHSFEIIPMETERGDGNG